MIILCSRWRTNGYGGPLRISVCGWKICDGKNAPDGAPIAKKSLAQSIVR